MPSLVEVNALEHAAFVAALGHLFEHSPWIAGAAWSQRPFRDAPHLHAVLCATMRAAPKEVQLALIRAHPDLAGRLAQRNKLTAESTREQASAGLNQLTRGEMAAFQTNNAAYVARFGFPFIVCARLTNKTAILEAMQARVTNPPDVEFATALGEIEKIAKLRLDDVLAGKK